MGANEEAYNSMITKASITNAANALNTPPVATPPRISTPPLGGTERRKSDKRALEATSVRGEAERATLLKEFEDGGRPRETTPGGSPSRKRQRVYGDRTAIAEWNIGGLVQRLRRDSSQIEKSASRRQFTSDSIKTEKTHTTWGITFSKIGNGEPNIFDITSIRII
ncbi:hypothetical protein M7I_1368 [Glarea lozoyensis 74030]|uniref:Uncharacterized protein n=1 Tax=Glarea lozoyensis (strain ATCC 74030 / MF5533) TaxID=1104152 RepID=H0EFW0_GLAL7|nr:hypothetical protein M7I_1368 [Glarea lozoyensis 74030]